MEEILFSRSDIRSKVIQLAQQISTQYDEIMALMVLNGAVPFGWDLLREIESSVVWDTVGVSGGGNLHQNLPNLYKNFTIPISGKQVLIIEDIIDTGKTMEFLINHIWQYKPESITVCSLLSKPSLRVVDGLPVDFLGWEIEDFWIVGYGLDYEKSFRSLPYIRKLREGEIN